MRILLLALSTAVLAGVAACGGTGSTAAPTRSPAAPRTVAVPVPDSATVAALTPAVATPPLTRATASSPTPPSTSTPPPSSATVLPTIAADVVIDCAPHVATREPSRFVLACADYGEVLTHLVWTSWSTTGATASGTAVVHRCTPDCASSTTYVDYPATLTLSRPVTPTGGTPHFTYAVAALGGSWRTDYPDGQDPQPERLPTH